MSEYGEIRKDSKRVRLRINIKERFPEKLYDVASDGYLVRWNGTGTAVCINEKIYEEKVMSAYPGFVQISTFPNIRRLFREYGFDWRIKETNGSEIFEFAHPNFVYGHRELLQDIMTRRKSYFGKIKFFSDVQDELENDDSTDGTRYKTRSKYKKKSKPSTDCEIQENDESRVTCDGPMDVADSEVSEKCAPASSTQTHNGHSISRHSSLNNQIMSLFIKNEFTFDDFCSWVNLNQTCIGQGDSNDNNCNQGSFGQSESASRLYPCHECACCLFYHTRYEVLDKPCMVILPDSDDEEGQSDI